MITNLCLAFVSSSNEVPDPEVVQDPRLVLVRDRARLPQHLHRRRGALQPAAVAHRVPL